MNNQFSQEQYHQHVQQLDQIKQEIEAQDVYIITQPIDLQLLESEYFENKGFLQKIQKVRQQFPTFRRVRRDGSCFYRAVLFRIMEHLIISKDVKLLEDFKAVITKSKDDLKAVGYDEIVITDFYDSIIAQLSKYPNITVEQTVEAFCDKMTSDYLIMYMRMLTSGYIKTNSFMFEGYIEAESIEKFCQQEVDPIDREADQLQIIALVNYLNIPLRIYYLDSDSKKQEATVVQIPEDADPNKIFINLLYRPGHYDILYQ